MNKKELKDFSSCLDDDMDKIAISLKPIRKFFRGKFQKNMGEAGTTLRDTAIVTGAIGLGGLGYAAVKHPANLNQRSNRKFKY